MDLLETICAELETQHAAHTVLLYGSRANGTESSDSDLDVAAFGPVAAMQRVAGVRDGVYVDAFLYPESVLEQPAEEHLRFRGARILLQRDGGADAFLARLDELHRTGPSALPADELDARRVWLGKMLARAQRGDAEGNYRRAWLLTALLEDDFHFRGLWYEGPKKALAWLQQHDTSTGEAMQRAFDPRADLAAIGAAIERVLGSAEPK
ncbi:MAG: nucleotidyltransferase domain-containing protein [Planctomycetota bacterium]|nr:nucleotidyltransferase domain-containing protein [Planctomycetota bacterium]